MQLISQGKTNWKYILIVVILAAIVAGGILAWQYGWIGKGLAPTKVEISSDEAIKLVKNFPEVKEWLSIFTEQSEIFHGKPCRTVKTAEGVDSGIRCTPEIKIDHIHIKG